MLQGKGYLDLKRYPRAQRKLETALRLNQLFWG